MATASIRAEALLGDRILHHAATTDLARLLVQAERRILDANEPLFEEGQPATYVYLIEDGAFTARRDGSQPATLSRGYVGAEAVIGSPRYRETVVAARPSTIVAFPVADLSELARQNHTIRELFVDDYLCRFDRPDEPDAHAGAEPGPSGWRAAFPLREVVGWLCAVLIPAALVVFGDDLGLTAGARYFLGTLAAAVCMWVFALVPEFVPPVFSVVVITLLDVAPAQVAFSGFTSRGFYLCLGVFGIGALMASSGLTLRLSLLILKAMPPGRFWYNVALFVSGGALTAVVSSPAGRMSMLGPFLIDVLRTGRLKPNHVVGTELFNTTIAGCTLVAAVFLTGKPQNLVVFGLFDGQTQVTFQWAHWLVAAAVSFAVLTVTSFVVSRLVFGSPDRFSLPRAVLHQQVRVLGPLRPLEWAALAAIAVMAVGVLTTAWHRVDIPWLVLTVLVGLLLMGGLGRADIRSRIDWPTLLVIGAIAAWGPVMRITELDLLITSHLGWIGVYMKQDLPLFVAMLGALVVAFRLVLPGGATTILLATSLFPIAAAHGMTPWVIGFIILTLSESYIFPYQSPIYNQLQGELAQHGLAAVLERKIVLYNVIMIFGRLASIYASLPFWRWLGIL